MNRLIYTALVLFSIACSEEAPRRGDLGEQVELCAFDAVDQRRGIYRKTCAFVSEACAYWLRDGDVNACRDVQVYDTECPCEGGDL